SPKKSSAYLWTDQMHLGYILICLRHLIYLQVLFQFVNCEPMILLLLSFDLIVYTTAQFSISLLEPVTLFSLDSPDEYVSSLLQYSFDHLTYNNRLSLFLMLLILHQCDSIIV